MGRTIHVDRLQPLADSVEIQRSVPSVLNGLKGEEKEVDFDEITEKNENENTENSQHPKSTHNEPMSTRSHDTEDANAMQSLHLEPVPSSPVVICSPTPTHTSTINCNLVTLNANPTHSTSIDDMQLCHST